MDQVQIQIKRWFQNMIYLDGKEKHFDLHTNNKNLFFTREQVDELYRRHVLIKMSKDQSSYNAG